MQRALTVGAVYAKSTDLFIKTDGALQTLLCLKRRGKNSEHLLVFRCWIWFRARRGKMEMSQLVLCSYWHERQHQRIQTRRGQALKNVRPLTSSCSGEMALEDKRESRLQTGSSQGGDRQTVRLLITKGRLIWEHDGLPNVIGRAQVKYYRYKLLTL